MSDKIEHFGEKDNLPDKANRQLPTGELSQDMLEMLESETDTFEAEDQFNFSDLLDPEDLEVFDGYTPEEKVKIFTALIESPEVQSDVYRVQQLKLLFQIVSEINAEFMDPKTRTMRLRKWYENWSNFITGEERFSGRYTKEFENLLKSDLEQFISTDMPRISEEVILGEKTVAQAIKEHPLLKSIVESYGLDFSPAQSEADIRRQTITTVDFLRSIKHYKAASDLIESSMEAMSEEKAKYMRAYQAVYDVQTAPFNDPEESKKRFEVQNALPTDLQNSGYELFLQRAELDKKIDGKRAKNMDFMKKNGMTEEQIAVYFDALKEELFSIKLSQYAAEKLDESKIPSEQIKLWNKYKEINDPKGEWFEFKDESIDKLIDTVVVNLPLIIGSGGMAAAIREGLSAGTKYLIGRVAARALIRGSGKYTAEELVLVGGDKIAKWAGSNLMKKFAVAVPGMAVEGAVFELMYAGLEGQTLTELPDWGMRILFAATTIGAFRKVDVLGNRFFEKGRFLDDYVTGKISNPAVQETVKQLVLKGHLEAATMLIMGAAQNGYYEGNFNEFFENFGENVLHAYVMTSGLKAAHGLAGSIGKKPQNKTRESGDNLVRDFQARAGKARATKAEVGKKAAAKVEALKSGELSRADFLDLMIKEPRVFKETLKRMDGFPFKLKEMNVLIKRAEKEGHTIDMATRSLILMRSIDFKNLASKENVSNALAKFGKLIAGHPNAQKIMEAMTSRINTAKGLQKHLFVLTMLPLSGCEAVSNFGGNIIWGVLGFGAPLLAGKLLKYIPYFQKPDGKPRHLRLWTWRIILCLSVWGITLNLLFSEDQDALVNEIRKRQSGYNIPDNPYK